MAVNRRGRQRDGPNGSPLPLDVADTGYGHDPDMVPLVTGDASSLLGYFEDVHEATRGFLRTLEEADLARVVDPNWDPPVTMAVRLVSVVVDDLQHVGQAAYTRGILQRREG